MATYLCKPTKPLNKKLKQIAMATQLTDSNFKETVLDSGKLTLVDFWAEWCGPCKAIGPVIEELSKEYDGKAIIGKVDVDSNPETAMKYGIRNIPTILFIKNGQVVDKQVGAVPKANLVAMLNKHLS
ncbi:MAG TPA: thioredoxin [Chitinophagales bacterium]|nr:thioredoxin [Chitinophagales bacterium]